MKRVPGPVADVYDAMGSEPEVPPHAVTLTREQIEQWRNSYEQEAEKHRYIPILYRAYQEQISLCDMALASPMLKEPSQSPAADAHAVIFPVTAEMVVAGANAHYGIEGGTAGGAIACYKAMRAVAPVSPHEQVWRDAIEAAAKVCDDRVKRHDDHTRMGLGIAHGMPHAYMEQEARECAAAIRSLPPPPAQEVKS